MKKLLLIILALAVAVACSFGVIASAADWEYSKINIADYLSSKEFVGDDVELTYDIPVAPYTEMSGVMADGTSEQLPSSTHVNFQNGKVYVTEPSELLYNWDFTQSLTDTVSGSTAVLKKYAGVLPTIDAEGVHFTVGGYIDLIPDTTVSLRNKTVFIDLPYSAFEPSSNYFFNLIAQADAVGRMYLQNNFSLISKGWRINGWYSGGYARDTFLDATEYPANFFSGKTVQLEFDALGYCTLYYAELGSAEFVEVKTGEYPFFEYENSRLYVGAIHAIDIPCTVSGIRIYENEKQVEVNKYEEMSFDMLILGESYADNRRVIDLSDIRSGSQYDLTIELDNSLSVNGSLNFPFGTQFMLWYLDKDFNVVNFAMHTLDLQQGILTDGGDWSYTLTNVVPDGVKYLYFTLDCQNLKTAEADDFQWVITHMQMSCMMSAIEDNSRTQQQILDKLDQIGGSVNDYINGDHGFDSSGSDFSGAADDLQNSSSQMNNAMSGGMNHLGNMMNSPDFITTLTTLGAGFDALFEGHEITICGITANPFTLVVEILAIAILIPLALKFIFRKWGSDSSGGGSDA